MTPTDRRAVQAVRWQPPLEAAHFTHGEPLTHFTHGEPFTHGADADTEVGQGRVAAEAALLADAGGWIIRTTRTMRAPRPAMIHARMTTVVLMVRVVWVEIMFACLRLRSVSMSSLSDI